jgi:hypothetical protein
MSLKDLRVKAGLTQSQGARIAGVSLRTWQSWETDKPSGRKCPTRVLTMLGGLPPGRITAHWVDYKGQVHSVHEADLAATVRAISEGLGGV